MLRSNFAAAVVCVVLLLVLSAPLEPAGAQSPTAGPSQPMVVHVHHHYYNAALPSTQLANFYSPQSAWNYGYQPGLQTFVTPWKQDWDHLGFTGYLGQQGEITGLVVDKLTPGSAAAKMGLVQGDFILSINGTPVDSYRQVAGLFEETKDDPKHKLAMEVWNPHTNRKNTINAVVDEDDK
jgi:membrane-associated protease RseP (regulator of RpoE activity)